MRSTIALSLILGVIIVLTVYIVFIDDVSEDISGLDTQVTDKVGFLQEEPIVVENDIDEIEEVIDKMTDREELVSTMALRGRVINSLHKGIPVTNFKVRLSKGVEQEFIKESEFNDKQGIFSIPVKSFGHYHLMITAEGYEWRNYRADFTSIDDSFTITLNPNYSLFGKVVDEDQTPIKGAKVGYVEIRGSGYIDNKMATELESEVITNACGEFFLHCLSKRPYGIFVLHKDFLEAEIQTIPDDKPLVITLKKGGYQLFGVVLDDNGNPAHDIEISFLSDAQAEERYTISNNGTYRSPYLPPGKVMVIADPKNRDSLFTRETKETEIVASDVELNFGMNDEYSTLQGVIQKYDGIPIVGAKLILGSKEVWGEVKLRKSIHFGVADINGNYNIKKIPFGSYHSHIDYPDGPDFYQTERFEFTEPGVYTYNILIPNTIVSGFVYEDAEPITTPCVVTATMDDGRTFEAKTSSDGSFLFEGLPEGKFRLRADSLANEAIAFESQPFELKQGVQQSINIVFPEKGSLSINIPDFEKYDAKNIEFYINSGDYYSRVWSQKATYDVAVGSWKIVAGRGKEFIAQTQEVIVRSGQTTTLTLDITHIKIE